MLKCLLSKLCKSHLEEFCSSEIRSISSKIYLQYCSREDREVMSGSVEAVRATLDQATLELASCTHPATARSLVILVRSAV